MLVTPSNRGSVGDEAMFVSAVNGLARRGATHVTAIIPQRGNRWPEDRIEQSYLALPDHFSHASWGDAIRFVLSARRHGAFCLIGADVLDGHYSPERSLRRLELVDMAARCGLETTIFGFSFNEEPSPIVEDKLRALPASVRLCARDHVSQARLRQTLGRDVPLVADLAFLLEPDESSDLTRNVAEWVRQRRAEGRMIVGVNLNPLVLGAEGDDGTARLIDSHATALKSLAERHGKLAIVLVPHDFRGKERGDTAILRRLLAALPPALSESSTLLEPPFTAAQVKGVAGHLDFSVTGRMHFAIACLGRGTPAVCVSYQGKVEGLADYLGIRRLTLTPANACEPAQLGEVVNWAAENHQSLRSQILGRLDGVLALSEQNFNNGSSPGPAVPALAVTSHAD